MMFDLFKKNENKGPKDVKAVRDILLRFIKEQLQKYEGGEGRNIKTIKIYIFCGPAEKHIYGTAVYADEKDRFKAEVQKIADDYAVNLPDNWDMEIGFVVEYPLEALKIADLDAAVYIKTKDIIIKQSKLAYLKVLSGQAGNNEFKITSEDGKINIGRGKKVQVDDGFFRENQIAFDEEGSNESNKFISRQHAHIEWDTDAGCFMLFADEGGVPPRNKVKVRPAANDNLIKLNSLYIGHKLTEGDQVILGESAVLVFTYNS